MNPFHYTLCGLDNVWLHNVDVFHDIEGERVVSIPNIEELHKAIAWELVAKHRGMSGRELRFLRVELDLTQTELGALLGKEKLTIGRWERGETAIDPTAETVIRLLVVERLGLSKLSVEDALALSRAEATQVEIRIDGSDPAHYRLAA